ncbi:hypothetical protein Prudu_979S000300 [Prunus dulcis]|uniref:Uncharacterized protein n=1 Tax=Prunus dulcis TaxID=3755 RepID=A0A5H2XRH3_PRUDU|nr:hypothetical protein Prudu_979S000300 [Prunus dulcis]
MFPFGFRHGSSDTTTELDPKEVDLDTNNLKINCTEDCGHDKNSYCHIKEFSLTGAALTGFIPKEVGKLKHLETLDLSMNQLNGSISELIKSLRNLTDL